MNSLTYTFGIISFDKEIDEKKLISQIEKKFKNLKHDEDNTDYLFVFGGDGTFVSALSRFRNLRKRFILINTGNLGFLSSVSSIEELNNDIFNEELFNRYNSINLISKEISINAINEISIISNTVLNFDLKINDKQLYEPFSSGFSFISPIGSTGLNRANNGPLFLQESNNMILRELNAVKTNKTEYLNQDLIIDSNNKLNVQIKSKFDSINIHYDNNLIQTSNKNFELNLSKSNAKIFNYNLENEKINKLREKFLNIIK